MSTTISRLYNWVTDKGNSVKITASRVDAEMDQVITALNRKVLCATSAPGSPIAGQTWVDTTNKLLKVYINNEWVIQGPVHIGTSAPGTAFEGCGWYDTTNNVLYFYNGSGWVMGGLNIAGLTEKETPANDDLFVVADSAASNALKKMKYTNVSKIVKTIRTQTANASTASGNIPNDDTIPQQTTEAGLLSSLNTAITPASATNILEITVSLCIGAASADNVIVCLFQDATADAIFVTQHGNDAGSNPKFNVCFVYYMTAGTTSETTFKVGVGKLGGAATFTLNGVGGSRVFGGAIKSSVVIREYTS